jgi:acetyl-CoA acetyltransferase
MRDIAIVSYAQTRYSPGEQARNEVEMLMPVLSEAVEKSGIPRKEIGFTCSGSTDYLAGQSFSFVSAVDALGAWPPIRESHVEMDGAWALYESWIKLQCGEVDSALVFAFGRSSMGDLPSVLTMQLDPYLLAPLHVDGISMAALQARALLDAGRSSEHEWAEIAARSRRDGRHNPEAQVSGDFDPAALMREPYAVSPLRPHAIAPVSDGAAAMVIAAGDLARRVSAKPVWIRGIDHRLDPHHPGVRDLASSRSARLAGEKAGAARGGFDVAELHTPFASQEPILREALGLDAARTRINPSGGPLAAHATMVAGLARIGEAARQLWSGKAERALAHATQGPCLQQNLVCVLEVA